MKKVFFFMAAVLFGIGVQAATYGILVNNTTFYEAEALSEQDFQGRDQFKASVSLNANDVFCVYDETNDAKFTIAIEAGEGSAKANFNEGAESATVLTAGCYDFYIKLKWEDNSMWVAQGSNCSATGRDVNPGGNEGGEGTTADAYWYYKGYIDGGDLENEAGGFNIFNCGTAELVVATDAYLFIMFQQKGVQGVQYMTTSYVDGPTHATMVTTGGEKLHVGAGSYTLYLYDNGDGSVELSTQPMAGKTLVKENCNSGTNIQLVVEKLDINAPMYDVLGRQVGTDYKGIVIQNGQKYIR